jgi:hypothetical protein
MGQPVSAVPVVPAELAVPLRGLVMVPTEALAVLAELVAQALPACLEAPEARAALAVWAVSVVVHPVQKVLGEPEAPVASVVSVVSAVVSLAAMGMPDLEEEEAAAVVALVVIPVRYFLGQAVMVVKVEMEELVAVLLVPETVAMPEMVATAEMVGVPLPLREPAWAVQVV